MASTYDCIVVGAGSAGCALAARLSENPDRSVLLLEAGPWYSGIDAYPPPLRYGAVLSAMSPNHPNNWNFVATLRPGVQQPLPRGRVVGGSSALNGALFTRGLPTDFDGWAENGNSEWAFDKVLPYYKKLEDDRDIDDEFHGKGGPVPVRRAQPDEWTPAARAFVESCQEAGFPCDPDMNAPTSVGVGALPVNNIEGIRFNTALAYLESSKERQNFTVRPNTFVRRVLINGGRAIGVEVEDRGQIEFIHADETILCAGAIKTPHLLMLSGVGPAAELNSFGIPIVQDSPFVGREFTDHCLFPVRFRTKARLNPVPDPTKSAMAHTGLHYTEGGPHNSGDVLLIQSAIPSNVSMVFGQSLYQRAKMLRSAMGKMSVPKLVDQVRYGWVQNITCLLLQSASRGEIRLTSREPEAKPALIYNLLEHPSDVARLRQAARQASELLKSDSYMELGAEQIAPQRDDLESDVRLDEYLREHVGTTVHMSSTCRMGRSIDTSVVDQYCKVHGISGLRVADTSIMPTVVRRSPAATAVMIGERVAGFFD